MTKLDAQIWSQVLGVKKIKWGDQGHQPGCWERESVGNLNVADILNGGSSISEFRVQQETQVGTT